MANLNVKDLIKIQLYGLIMLSKRRKMTMWSPICDSVELSAERDRGSEDK